eukprot:s5173_g1.t1
MASLAPSAALEAVFLRSYVAGWRREGAAGFGPTQTVQTSFRALITYGSMTDSAASGRAGRRVRERAQETLIRMVCGLVSLAAPSASADVKYQIWRSLRAVCEAGAEDIAAAASDILENANLRKRAIASLDLAVYISRDRGIFPAKRRHSYLRKNYYARQSIGHEKGLSAGLRAVVCSCLGSGRMQNTAFSGALLQSGRFAVCRPWLVRAPAQQAVFLTRGDCCGVRTRSFSKRWSSCDSEASLTWKLEQLLRRWIALRVYLVYVKQCLVACSALARTIHR